MRRPGIEPGSQAFSNVTKSLISPKGELQENWSFPKVGKLTYGRYTIGANQYNYITTIILNLIILEF